MKKIQQLLLVSVIAGGMLSSLQASSSSDGDIHQAIVIDNGSSIIRAGFVGDNSPRSVFPSIVGRPRHRNIIKTKDYYVGDEVQSKKGILTIKYPIENGIVTNWDDMETIWQHTFSDALKINPAEHSVLLTEIPLNPKANREKTTQVMFETFNVPGVYLGNTGVLSLYASGRKTGLVVESGYNSTSIVPIYEGHALPYAATRINMGSRDLEDQLSKFLYSNPRFVQCTAGENTGLARKDILENKCFVKVPTFDLYLSYHTNDLSYGDGYLAEKLIKEEYEIPDGTVISLGEERWKVPEILFKPSLIGRDFSGIHQEIYDSIIKVDADLRTGMFVNIVLAGGNTMFPGIDTRLLKELQKLAPAGTKIRVVASPDRKYSAWIGGSILAKLSTFPNDCVSKQEYCEYGSQIVHRKLGL